MFNSFTISRHFYIKWFGEWYPVDVIDSDGVPVSVVQSGRMFEYNSWDICAQREGKLNLPVEQLQGEVIVVFVITAIVEQQAVFRPCREAVEKKKKTFHSSK